MDENKSVRLIRACMEVRRKINQAAGQDTLTQGEYMVLRRIKIEREGNAENLGIFKAVRISEYLSIPPPAVTRILNSLERQGLIERRINAENRRSVIIALTESGEKVLLQAEGGINAFANRLTAALGESESDTLLRLLEKTIEFCEKEKCCEDNGDD